MEMLYSNDMKVRRIGKRFWLDYYYNGERIRESIKVSGKKAHEVTEKEANKAMKRREAEIETNTFDFTQVKKQVLFARAIKSFLENYSKHKKSYERDKNSSKPLLKFFDGKQLSFINSWQVDKYKSHRLKTISIYKRPISKTTVNRELAFLKTMLNYCVKRGWIKKSPLTGYKLFKEKMKKDDMAILNLEEWKAFHNAASKVLKPIIETAYYTGMRRGEILNLKWGNVDLENKYILVVETKSDENRTVYINKPLYRTLNELKSISGDGFVFTNRGKPVKDIRTAFSGALKRSGIKKFTFHDLRHTFASNLVHNGFDLVTVKELLGHSSIQMTMRYTHANSEQKRRAVESLDIDSTGQKAGNKIGLKVSGNSSNANKH